MSDAAKAEAVLCVLFDDAGFRLSLSAYFAIFKDWTVNVFNNVAYYLVFFACFLCHIAELYNGMSKACHEVGVNNYLDADVAVNRLGFLYFLRGFQLRLLRFPYGQG